MSNWSLGNGAMMDQSYDGTILVVDPATRKLNIPLCAVAHTQALVRPDRVPSICMLFLAGRCRQGPMCHQIHADPVVVEKLRSSASHRLSCCPEHGEDAVTLPLASIAPSVQYVSIEGYGIPVGCVATTTGMRRTVAETLDLSKEPNTFVIARSQVCRLHMQGRCRYSEDCNFVHLCRTFTTSPQHAELANMLNAATPNAKRFYRTPAHNFNAPQVPPSPYYAGTSATPSVSVDAILPLDHDSSQETTPPSTPALNASLRSPLGPGQPWRYEPYSWQCVSPVRAQ